jgi:Holliday junction resolvase
MTSANKAKGSQFERDVAKYLRANGFPEADRRYGAGVRYDKGDLVGVPGFVIECKNQAKINLAEFVAEAIAEAANAGVEFGVAVVKRRQRPVSESYVVMTLEQFAVIAERLGKK